MKPGGEFQNAQGAVDLFGLIGQVIRPQAGAQGAANGAGAAPPAADPYPAGH
jgi:phospholipid/cholesterol/gamma-HCH transport system substrate-binding protein